MRRTLVLQCKNVKRDLLQHNMTDGKGAYTTQAGSGRAAAGLMLQCGDQPALFRIARRRSRRARTRPKPGSSAHSG